MQKICFCFFLIFLITHLNLGFSQDVITMVYRPTEKIPYIEAVPSNKGLYQVIFKEAARKIGLGFKIERYPKKRAYLYLKKGIVDFYPGASFNESREKIGYFIDNCMALKGGMLLYREDLNIRDISGIKGYNLLYNLGGTTVFYKIIGVDVKANFLHAVPQLDIQKAISLLKYKRSDFYAYDLTTVEAYLKKNRVIGIKRIPVRLKNQIDTLIFSKKSKYYKERSNPNYDSDKELSIDNLPYTLNESCFAYKFQQVLKSMQKSGEINRIHQKYMKLSQK